MTEAELKVIRDRFAEAKTFDDVLQPARQASLIESFAHDNVPALIAEVFKLRDTLRVIEWKGCAGLGTDNGCSGVTGNCPECGNNVAGDQGAHRTWCCIALALGRRTL